MDVDQVGSVSQEYIQRSDYIAVSVACAHEFVKSLAELDQFGNVDSIPAIEPCTEFVQVRFQALKNDIEFFSG